MDARAVIRSATSKDVDRLAHLWAEHVDFHAQFDPRFERTTESEGVFADYLRDGLGRDDVLLLTAEVGGEVVGFLLGELSRFPPCFVHRAHGLINDIAISPRWRRTGIGTEILHEAMVWFRDRGVPTVEASVLMANPVATDFWAKAGFEPYLQTVRRPVGGELEPEGSG